MYVDHQKRNLFFHSQTISKENALSLANGKV